jgi:glycosyltransferase involved in cell wall biosynthesis
MKITIVGTAHPLRGGIAHYNALLYRELVRHHEVEIVTFARQYPGFLFPGTSQIDGGGTGDFEVPSRVLVDSINPLNWVSVGRTIRRSKPDLLLFKYWLPFFGPCFGTIARTVKRGTGTRVVYICDNVIPHERRPGDRVFTKYAFGPADGFVVQSASVERDLHALIPGARSILVPHPVYHGFGSRVPAEVARAAVGVTGKDVLLFFGYVRRYKGLGVLLDAMALLKHRLDLQLLVVGEFYDDERPYRDRIEALGIQDAVIVRSDYVPNDEVKNYFSAADAVVLPYSSATQSGIAQIAYNFDLPVIATTVGGLAEAVLDGETGVLVPPENPQALADGIMRFFTALDHEKLRARVAEEKKRYSWEHLGAAIERLASER